MPLRALVLPTTTEPTPDTRTRTVPAESRETAVAAEPRGTTVAAESRRVEIKP